MRTFALITAIMMVWTLDGYSWWLDIPGRVLGTLVVLSLAYSFRRDD